MDQEESHTSKRTRKNPNFLSNITYAWLFKIFFKGNQKELTEADLLLPLSEHSSHVINKTVKKVWNDKDVKYKRKGKLRPKLFSVLGKCFLTQFLFWSLVQIFKEFILKTFKPIILGKVLSYFNSKNENFGDNVHFWIGGLILNLLLQPFFETQIWYYMLHLEIKIRVACCSLIYGKVLKLSKTALKSETTIGQIINHLNNDTKCITEVLACVNFIWISPMQSLLIAFLIYKNISLAAVSGVVIFIITIPLQGYFAKIVPRLSLKAADKTDQRLSLTNETVSGIEVIKMFAWEKYFLGLVDNVRAQELKHTTNIALMKFGAISFCIFNSRIAIFVSLLLCVIFDKNLTAESVFILTMYFDIIQNNMNVMFPVGLQRGGVWLASMKRLQSFLDQQEIRYSSNGHFKSSLNENHKLPLSSSNSEINVTLNKASAKWTLEAKENTLDNISFSAKRGSLVAVVGQVGSGKTSLLQSILQELPLIKGSVYTLGTFAYVSQDPWIFSSSIRQNIIFSNPMDKERYEKVVTVCQLDKDFSLFPNMDQTIVGEKGINLSGGQRARIALARAVYADADIYLLDDPLSAVDSRVGRLIFNDCICSFLNGKTRILVTHQLQYLSKVDYIYVLDNGSVLEEGSSQDLECGKISLKGFNVPEEQGDNLKNSDIHSGSEPFIDNLKSEVLTSDQQQEEVAEHRAVGKVSISAYISYLKANKSTCLVILVFSLAVFRQLVSSGSDYFISLWANAQQSCTSSTTNSFFICAESFQDNLPYVGIYGGLTTLLVAIVFSHLFSFIKMCQRSSQNMHSTMFYRIVRSKMSFFYENSAGRILNRFSKDIFVIDKEIPFRIYFMKISLLQVVVVIVMSLSLNYWLLIPTIVTSIILYLILTFYIKTSRSVKRLDGITQSPVIKHLSDTLRGLDSVRAYRAQDLLTTEYEKHLDLNTASSSLFIGCAQWIQLYVEVVFAIFIAAIVYTFFFLNNNNTIANVGLIITQIIIVADTMAWSLFNMTEAETLMTSVERILEYSNIKEEPFLESSSDNKPSKDWPLEGCVEFKNVCLRYHTNDAAALKNINFVIKPKEKIGIVGRTGAGKSSLIAALFRLTDTDGKIFIDGALTSELGLHDLRSKINIIPQQPLLFSGTIRRNLDPSNEVSDEALWQALDEVELKTVIGDMESGLESNISDGGSNFSMGQRQLLCLARAIIRKNKILVLDEATANVDTETDRLIQETIRKKYENCTVLIIAHRLNTIMDCDRVMVLDAGEIVEFDSPLQLKLNKGLFHDMVQQAGPESTNKVMKVM